MKTELEKLVALNEEYDKLYEFLNKEPIKKAGEGWTEEEKIAWEKRHLTQELIWEEEKRIYGNYWIDPCDITDFVVQYTKEEWEKIKNIFKDAVLKAEEVAGDKDYCYGFFEAAFSKACTELWEE